VIGVAGEDGPRAEQLLGQQDPNQRMRQCQAGQAQLVVSLLLEFFVEPVGGTGLRFAYALLRWMQLGEHNGDSAVPGLNRDVALAQPVPRVIAELAEDFEALATPIMNLSQVLREETARLAATRDALLPELMSGRLTIRTLEGSVR